MTELQTAPFDEGSGSRKATTPVSIRFDEEMLRRIDERRAQAPGGLNRSAWVIKALDWVLANLPTGLQDPQRGQVAKVAPEEVAGSKRLPGTTDYGNPSPKAKERVDRDGVVHGDF